MKTNMGKPAKTRHENTENVGHPIFPAKIYHKNAGRPPFPFFSAFLWAALLLLFILFIALGVRSRRPAATGGIAGYICLECMGFK